MQVVLVYHQPFWRNLLLKCVSQPEIAKNLLKPPILGVQGHSRSSMLTFLRSSMPVLVIISSISVPICNYFHVRRAYSVKITLLRGSASLLPPRSRGSPLPSGMKFCHEILEKSLSYPKSLFYLVLDWYRVVTDGQTDGQTDRQNYRK